MKTLYESILDDEDVLISNIENSISDPFTAIVAAFNSGISKSDFENIIQGKIFDKFVEKELYLNPKDFFWNVLSFTDYMISMSLYNKETGEYRCIYCEAKAK